jgi:ADP-ribose pyrophosphatase
MIIRDLTRLTDEKWINLFAATFEHNGHTGRWVFASRRKNPHAGGHPADAVLIVPVLVTEGRPNRLVLIREFRVPVNGYVIGLPAGLLEEGEAVDKCVRRELREETGFEVVRIKRVTQALLSSSGLSDEAVAMAFVDATGDDASRPALEASEDLEVLLLDYDAVCRLCDDQSAAMDAKVWTLLYLFRTLGRIE